MYLARQLFVPAFLTLLLLCVVALWIAPAVRPAVEPAATLQPTAPDAAGMAFALPGQLLQRFQNEWPLAGRLLALAAALGAGIAVGRISVRSNLYGVNTCLSIPLFGIFVCLLAGQALSLPLLLAVLLLARSVRRFGEALRDGYTFDPLVRASSGLGLLVLLRPAALPILLLLPFGVVLFQRTRRETVVALFGLLLAPLLCCYLNWWFGGTFDAPLVALWNDFAAGLPAALFRSGWIPWMGLAAALLLLDLFGVGAVWANFYSVNARARYLLLFHTGALLLTLAVLCGPAAAPADSALLAVPSAVLLPFFFVRIRASFASILYLLLLAVAILSLFIPAVGC